MPGPWFLPREDQGAWGALPAALGDYLELKLLDSDQHPQGMALVRVEERENPGHYGEWFQATIVAVSDGYLQWTLCKALDLVVEGEARRAADILAERVKATEAALHDDNWLKAQFVELLPREGSLLLETACQLALESKVKEAGQRMSWGQGKGRWTGRPDNSEPPPLQLSTLPEKGKKGEGKKGKGEKGQKVSPVEAEKEGPSNRKRRPAKKELKKERAGGPSGAEGGGVPPAAAERFSPGAEEWATEEIEALGLSEDEDTLQNSFEHKSAVPGWWNLKKMQKAITTLLERKPTWEQVLEWLMDEARRFPSARGAHQTRTSPWETVPEGCSLEGAIDALNLHYCCGPRQTFGRTGCLSSRSRNYKGNLVERVGEITADLVIGAWPQAGGVEQSRGCGIPAADDGVSAVPRDSQGHLITNGAGAVEKRKVINGREVIMQRFISNFVPINEYLEALPGDQVFLPYVAQLGLLLLEEGGTLLIESDDLTSAFNLFRMPDAWLPYFYAKKVSGHILGSSEEWVRPGLRVIPMGWSSAVTIMQAILRNLVFDKAGIPESLEIAKIKDLPAEGGAVLYLDSFDQVRMVDTSPKRASLAPSMRGSGLRA
eukprot:s1083_g23.t1